MNELLKPRRLQEGDSVALVSPVNIPPKKYWANDRMLAYLEDQGLSPKDMTCEYDTVKKRTDSFNNALTSEQRALFPVSGNRYAKDVIQRINYDLFRVDSPPIFTTFSAASSLLLALHTYTDGVVFYGPHLSFLHTDSTLRENPYTIASYWNLLKDGEVTDMDTQDARTTSPLHYVFKRDNEWKFTNIFSRGLDVEKIGSENIPFISDTFHQAPEKIEGNLLPVFLQSLLSAIESGVPVDFKDKLVMVESDEISFEEAYNLFQKIQRLSNLDQAVGIILASFVTHKDPPNSDLEQELYDPQNIHKFTQQVKNLLKGNVPIIYGFPMGHLRYKLTIPMGPKATLDLQNGDVTLKESPFKKTEII